MPSYVEHVHSSLTQLAAGGADVRQIAARAVAMWCAIDTALSPIIGQRGVAALFKRSLLLTDGTHTSLVAALDELDTLANFTALRATLEQLSSTDAIETNCALLQKFSDLLIHLIGKSLTERLLHSVQADSSSEGTVREQSS